MDVKVNKGDVIEVTAKGSHGFQVGERLRITGRQEEEFDGQVSFLATSREDIEDTDWDYGTCAWVKIPSEATVIMGGDAKAKPEYLDHEQMRGVADLLENLNSWHDFVEGKVGLPPFNVFDEEGAVFGRVVFTDSGYVFALGEVTDGEK